LRLTLALPSVLPRYLRPRLSTWPDRTVPSSNLCREHLKMYVSPVSMLKDIDRRQFRTFHFPEEVSVLVRKIITLVATVIPIIHSFRLSATCSLLAMFSCLRALCWLLPAQR
jgi:hypothetical protein